MYGEVLGLDPETISIHDDFFRLGGNSIMAIKLIGKIKHDLDMQVNVGMVFNHKTVASLSDALIHADNNEEQINIIPVKVNTPEEQRLSFAQERLWFIESYEGGSSAYNIPIITMLDDSIRLNLLQQALNTVISRHEILRSMIQAAENGVGYQVVTDHLPEMNVTEAGTDKELKTLINKWANKVFRLDEEIPVDINLLTLEGRAYLSVVIHHIAFDGWSTDIFLKEVATVYNALADGKEPDLSPVKVQYKDFALWQREYLSGERLANQISYWKNKLDDFQNLELPEDFKRPVQISYEGENLYFSLNAEQAQKLRALSKKLGVSLYSVMLGGYYLMLSAYSGQDDIVVGSPIANRHRAGLEDIIGFFVNTLALREKINPAQSISDFIVQVSKSVTEAQSHQDLPFEKLVDELGVEQDTSRHPVFQVMFGLQNIDGDIKANEEEALFHPFPEEVDYKAAKFDITTMIDDDGENINIMFNYAKALFREETIIRMAGSYQLLLDQITENSPEHTSIRSLSLISEEETCQIIERWNSTQEDYPSEMTIQELFELQAEKNPDTIALVYNEVKLSYRELNERSNRLAGHLIHEYNLQPDDLVPLCLERSENMLIAILAVLKAGAAYVPMDPSYPADRIGHILEDTQAKLVIAQKSTREKLQNIEVLSLDEITLKAALDVEVANNPVTKVNAGNLAYVIYTSGTTGLPKGVMIEHKGVINLIRSMVKAHRLQEYQEVGCYSNYVFDAFVYEAFPVLCNGNTLWLYNNELRTSVTELNEYITAHAIEVSFIPPVLLREIVENGTSLQLIFAGGESFPALDKNIENITLVNEYGPTEGTVCVTLHEYKEDKNPLNIGGPIANTTSYVLDAQYRPVPVGAVGELYIGGAGIARGYLNRPELTEERFILNPFQTPQQKEKGENGRLYRTGDLVRWLPNGELEYRGRNDFQIKIRGHRIELGEIENTLLQYEEIRQTAVMARENKSGLKYIAAYYVSDSAIDSNLLSEYVSGFLPEYMIPGAFVHLNELPLTINGKLDRRALPEPEFTGSKEYTTPETELQTKLCKIYGEVLGLNPDTISIHDDFFRLGGDSIISIQLVGKIRQQLEVRLSVKEVFTARTVVSLSLLIEDKQPGSENGALTEQGILTGEVSLLPVQEWFFEQKHSGYLVDFNHWNQSFLIHVPELEKDVFENAIDHLLMKHDAFRLHYTANLTQEYKTEKTVPVINYLDASTLSQEQLSMIFTEWQSHFDIENGPLYQIGYITGYQDGSARIFFAFHHLIIDAVSWRILTEDLKYIYQALEKGEDYQVQKGSSYRQWVAAISDYKKENPDSRDKESVYWKHIADTVEESNATLSKLITREYHYGHLLLDRESTSTLIRGVHHVYHTQINDLLLSALSRALTDVTGDERHAILLEGHGREEIFGQLDITETMGWFTTMYPVQLETGKSLKDTVILTKESLRNIPNNGIGYGSLLGYTSRELPKISFNYLGQLDQEDVTGDKTWFIAAEDSGAGVGSSNRDSHFVSINGAVVDGQLRFGISGYLSDEKITLLSENFRLYLDAIIKTLSEEGRTYLTASDVDHVVGSTQLSEIQDNGEIEGVYLANSLQEGFVYHALNQGETDDAYRVQLMWEYCAKINVEELRNSWELTQAQYPSLRIRFSWNGEIVQVIDKEGQLDWRYEEISHLSEEVQKEYIQKITHNDRFEGYDLSKGSLFRVYLFKRNEEYYSCLFSNHHAILDGWSMPVILNTVHDIYLKLLNGQEPSLSVDHAYADSQKYLQEHKESGRDFWKKYMELLEDREDLSSLVKEDQRSTEVANYRHIRDHQKVIISIAGDQYHALKSFTKSYGLTVNAVLQYLWHSQLRLYSGSATTVVGTTVSGRNLPVDGIESSAGLYINTLPLIVSHEEGLVTDRIMEIQNRISDLNSHSDISLAELHHDGRRIFSSLFVYENYPVPKGEGSNELGFAFKDSVEKLDYPLGIMASEQGDRITVKVNYEGVLFEKESIEQLMKGMKTVLEQILNDHQITSDRLVYLSNKQQELMVVSSNGNSEPVSTGTLHELFEIQAEKTPDQVALVYGNTQLTYRELNERANRLANHLIANYDLQPDDLVPLCLERSEYMLIAILGVLKSGAAYVPMDPLYPADRISHILTDTQPKIILGQQQALNRLENNNRYTISLDDAVFNAMVETEDAANPLHRSHSGNLAYVIYTSGTTGLPKGVMVEHGNVVNVVEQVREAYGYSEGEKITAYTSYVFDVSVSEFFNTLLYGNELHLLDEETKKDADSISRYLLTHEIAYAYLPPVMLSVLPRIEYPDLKGLLYAGEPCDYETGKYWSEYTHLYNLYGPTEATIYATYKKVEQGDVQLIGRALNNSSAYILDDHYRLLPVRAVGELYLGGAGIARGYLNREDLTAERFVNNPYQTEKQKSASENGRLYRTGDLVRRLADGNIEYIGRNDFQVKIRGYRIELGEIENRLSQYTQIRQSVVLAKDNSAGMKYLAGYYVSDTELEAEKLKAFLSEALPEYMIPSAFVHLTALPLTINGKLDRKLLPEPEFTGDEYTPPMNERQEKLCRIYGEVLGVHSDHISITADFFRLGGNSIMAIKLMGKIKQELGLQANVSMVFNHKTVALLEAALTAGEASTEVIDIIPVEVNMPEEQHLSFAQERLWFIESYQGGSSAYNIPMTVMLDQKVDAKTLYTAIETIVMRHEVLRTLIRTNEEGAGYQIVTDRVPQFKMEEVETREELEIRISNCSSKVFHLDSEIPIEINSFRFRGRDYLSVVIHHIAFDGWSTEVFLKELDSIYHALALGEASVLPPLKFQYKDFALWQRNYLYGERLDRQIGYWKTKLEDYQSLDLPTDFHRPAEVSYEGKTIGFTIPRETSEGLREVSKNLGVSLYSVMLSGYYLMLSTYSGQDDIVVGSPIANRHYSGLEDLIGFFVNTLALREKINSEQNVKDFIRQVADSVTEAQSHQDLPFEKLVEELKVEQDTSRHPVFQVMFGLQNSGHKETSNRHEEVLFHPFDGEMDDQAAKFDLTTMINDGAETIDMTFNYAVSLFKKETITRMADSYQFLLDQMVRLAKNNLRIREFQLIPEKENRYITENWNQTQREYPDHQTIHELFEEQVEKTPDNIAVIFQDTELTYRVLNKKVNTLAHYLLQHFDIRPDDLIPLYIDRSENMLIAILAVLKTGAAYVPIDPSYPADRIKHILDDTNAQVVLCNKANEDILYGAMEGRKTRVLTLENCQKQEGAYPDTNPATEVNAGNLAYVIYTSGTTGKPKGVMIEHKSVNRLIRNTNYISIHEKDRILSLSSFVFDASVFDTFGALYNGAALVIQPSAALLDINNLEQVITGQHISVFFVTTALFNTLVEEGGDWLSGLKYILFGGEKVSVSHVQRFRSAYSHIHLLHVYGPTETTTFATSYACEEQPLDAMMVPIGKPIANTSAYVLDAYLRPIPVGAVGELYIGGAGTARGYLNSPEMTLERFINNPFQSSKDKESHYNSHMYKTGDLVRFLPDGNIEYIGRNDFQVKIRGYRIELGEIENRLFQYPGVRQAVVLAKENNGGMKYLAGYYVSDSMIDPLMISEFLSETLPDYMIPNVYMHLEHLPLTINGKIDKRGLPEPGFVGGSEFAAPENELQHNLAGIYGEVLGLDPKSISIHDDFFRLGGNSIMAIKVISKIRQHLNIQVKIAELFKEKTIRKLFASIINDDRKHKTIVPFDQDNHNPKMFLIHPGNGGCEVYQSLAEQLKTDYDCYGVDSYNLYHEEKIGSLKTLAHYYLDHINEIQETGGQEEYILVGWSLGGNIALEIASELESRGCRNITVYLLDTIFYASDQKLVEFLSFPSDDELSKKLNIPVDDSNFTATKNFMSAEYSLVKENISSHLHSTKIVLFKAMLEGETFDQSFNTYIQQSLYNNIDSIVDNRDLLSVYPVNAAHHTMLEQKEQIIDLIRQTVTNK
ncbi:non-ribosomal peptide synthetase [Chryseobacterium pennipullorum]|uniref:non-ribosomal peptide synthetase n=1 Tax=Chryseobacterium pennipullorum TaxID=2258963 RepID=UPI001E3B826D|nr:non-ribosomal peptide synthetase [Chryseobacterium pennipullorum]